jgi:hypothetical protein
MERRAGILVNSHPSRESTFNQLPEVKSPSQQTSKLHVTNCIGYIPGVL